MRWLLALAISLLGSAVAFADTLTATSHLYGVIFNVTSDKKGQVDTLNIAEVIDPATGSTDPINLSVPNVYVAAAKAWLMQRNYPPNEHFFTYTIFDPLRPSKADIDPKSGRP